MKDAAQDRWLKRSEVGALLDDADQRGSSSCAWLPFLHRGRDALDEFLLDIIIEINEGDVQCLEGDTSKSASISARP